jgi:antitoxin HicB
MLRYAINLIPDEHGTFLVTVPDVPGVNTYGDNEDDALDNARQAIETMLMFHMRERHEVPMPSSGKRRAKFVDLSPLSEAKIGLYRAMRSAGVTKAGLARRLNVHAPQVDRLLDLSHSSKIENLDAAFRAVGKRLTIGFEDAA